MEENWKLFGHTHETEYQLARRRTFLKIDLDQLTKNVNILRKLCSDQTGKITFCFRFCFNFRLCCVNYYKLAENSWYNTALERNVITKFRAKKNR